MTEKVHTGTTFDQHGCNDLGCCPGRNVVTLDLTYPHGAAMTDLLSNPSLKRFILSLATLATIALNKKLGLQLDPVDIAALASFALGFVIQSAAKEVKIAGQEAAAKVTDAKAALDVFNAEKK